MAKAQADGYTLGVGAAGALSANVSLYPQMPFDPLKDFKPVAHARRHSLRASSATRSVAGEERRAN